MGETPSLTGQFVGDPQGPRMYTSHPTQESGPDGPNLLVGSGGSDWKPAVSRASGTVPSWTLSPQTASQRSNMGCAAQVNTLGSAPYYITGMLRPKKKKKGPNERTDQSSRKNTTKQWIANLSDAQFKTLVIRLFAELAEYGCKLKEKMKAMLREIKKNVQGTNSDRKETETQIKGLWQKEEINIEPEQKEATKIQKNEERLRNLGDNFQRSNIQIIGVPEGEEEEQEIENLFEKNNGELPQAGKGNRLPGSPRNSESPKEVGPKEAHTKAHHNYISQD